MSVEVEKKFVVEVIYNGLKKNLEVLPEEQVTALLQKAIFVFGVVQNPHLLSLFREDGTVVPENESVHRAGIKPCEELLLRPNVVKGGGELLRLKEGIIGCTFRTLRDCGLGECECAVFWIGPAMGDLVDSCEHPVHRRSPFGYEVDDRWLTEFWRRLGTSHQSVKAQVHTHPGAAFHSGTDDKWPIVSQAGFLSIVIPDFAVGASSLERAWIGRLQADGKWRHVTSADEVLVPA